jgi:hypothetical protein
MYYHLLVICLTTVSILPPHQTLHKSLLLNLLRKLLRLRLPLRLQPVTIPTSTAPEPDTVVIDQPTTVFLLTTTINSEPSAEPVTSDGGSSVF